MKLSYKITKALFGKTFLERKADLINAIDPDRVYAENIRHIFGLHIAIAKSLCEMAVRQGFFIKRIAVNCPNDDCGRVIKSFDYGADIPSSIVCDICEGEEREKCEFDTKDIQETYYQLNKKHE